MTYTGPFNLASDITAAIGTGISEPLNPYKLPTCPPLTIEQHIQCPTWPENSPAWKMLHELHQILDNGGAMDLMIQWARDTKDEAALGRLVGQFMRMAKPEE